MYPTALGPLSRHAPKPHDYHYLLKQEALMRLCAKHIEAQTVSSDYTSLFSTSHKPAGLY